MTSLLSQIKKKIRLTFLSCTLQFEQDAVLCSEPALPNKGKMLNHLLLECGSFDRARTFGSSLISIWLALQTWAFPSPLVLQQESGVQLKLFNLLDLPDLFSLSLFLKNGEEESAQGRIELSISET